MVGTHPQTMGGISSVVRGYMQGGLFDRINCRYVVTHRDGSAITKLLSAVRGFAGVCAGMLMLEAPLIHVHLSSRASFWRKSLVCLAAVLGRRPYVLHMHGSEFMTFFDTECGPIGRALVRAVFARAALVLALSEQWRDDLLRVTATVPIVVLPNAVSLPPLPREVPSLAHPEVLFLGRLGTRKGTYDLVRAFAQVVRHVPGARLICAGDGDIDAIVKLVRSLGLGESVSCPGWLAPDETSRLLARAALFVLPSYAEGLPMALLEAMAWGIPVVSTPVGGIPQVLQHGLNGWLVSPGDIEGLASALLRLLEDRASADRLGKAARHTIERSFSLTSSIERLLDLYARFGITGRQSVAGRTA
jgi:glycosyltransferase involved in cell wall biosynthesis